MIGYKEMGVGKQGGGWRDKWAREVPQSSLKKIQNYIFNFQSMLGQGNFSKVYRGYNQITNQPVAIKIVELNSLKSKKLQELLFSEIEILKKLNHPNILKCHEVFTSQRNCYIITEICNEGDLESKLRDKKYMKEEEAEPYVRGIYKGLMYLAENGVVHRDIKVSNIFIHDGEAKIADFGFAKVTRSKFKDINIGSPIYMSPEGYIDNVYGPKTDIWAFGILIYQLLHGQTPYSHCKSENELKYNLSIPIGWSQLKAQLSTDIKQVILKCLEVDESKRITAAQLGNLTYFKTKLPESGLKIWKDFRSGLSLDYNSLKSQSFSSLSKGGGKDDFLTGKWRIKTEIENTVKKEREPSSAIYLGKYRQERDSCKLQKDSASYLKTIFEGEKKVKQSSSFNSLMVPRGVVVGVAKTTSVGRSGPILSTQLTFKQCVNILHYCRLLFKHLILMRDMGFGDENQRSIFKRWLSTVLKSIKLQIQDHRVICEGDSVAARERKLQQVTGEYIKKYTKQLDLDLDKIRLQETSVINYQKICNYFWSVEQLVDQLVTKDPSNVGLLQLGHSMVMIVSSSRVLRVCFQQRSYRGADRLREIQDFLSVPRENLDLSSYQWYKKKYL